METLSIHETNARNAGQEGTVASWLTYSKYVGGLVEKLNQSLARAQGAAEAEAVAAELRTAISQVPPRP